MRNLTLEWGLAGRFMDTGFWNHVAITSWKLLWKYFTLNVVYIDSVFYRPLFGYSSTLDKKSGEEE